MLPAAQGTEGDGGLQDKGLADAEEHQLDDCYPESVVQVIVRYHPDLGKCGDMMCQT